MDNEAFHAALGRLLDEERMATQKEAIAEQAWTTASEVFIAAGDDFHRVQEETKVALADIAAKRKVSSPLMDMSCAFAD